MRAYRVLVVDDEDIVREAIRGTIPWEQHQVEIVSCAANAPEAMAWLEENKADLVITDIRMPGDDGLTMLAGLRSEFPEMQVAVLTGYREFSYAQEAIRLGVTRFLLKPSRMDEIHEALEAMTARLSSGNTEETAESENAGSFLINQATAYMQKHYAEKLTLQDVADACYVSQWHLSKLMNRHTGKSFYDILNTLRIRAAKDLLKDPGLRISDIGEMVGYADTAHFAKVFKKLVGMSANEYRNSL